MKSLILLPVFLLLFCTGNAQDLRKQLNELDTAFYHDDYPKAKQLIRSLYQPMISYTGNDTLVVEFLNTCGSVWYHTEQYDSAIFYFSRAAALAKEKIGEGEYHYALACFNQAACLKELGRYAEAEPFYLSSLPVLAPAMGQSSLQYTRCFYSLASLYIDMGKYAEAENMCAAAVNFYKTILGQTSDDYLGALGSMGVIYQGLAKYAKAEEVFQSLKKYYAGISHPPAATLQVLENNLGELYRHMGEYEKAAQYLKRAVAMAGDSSLQAASSLNNLALVQKAIGDYEAAERSYKKAIIIYIRKGMTTHPDYTNPVNNLGELYRTMGRLQEAVYAFEEVIGLRKQLLGTDHPNYANAVNNLALVEFAIGHYADAEKHLIECRDIYKRTLGEKDKFYANALNNLASVYKADGRLLLAETTYKECLQVYKTTYGESSDKYGTYLGGLAGTYRQMKKYEEAIALTIQSMTILRNKLGAYHYDYIETVYNLAETCREAGRYADAEKYYLEAMKGYLLLIEKYFPYLGERDKTAFYYSVSNAFETFNSFVIEQLQLFPAAEHQVLVERMFENQVALKSLLLKESEKLRTQIAASGNEALQKEYRQWLQLREDIVQQYRLSAEELEAKGVNLASLQLQANELEQRLAINTKTTTPLTTGKAPGWNDIRTALQKNEYAVEMVRIEFYANARWTDTVYYAALVLGKEYTTPKLVWLPNGNEMETKGITGYRIAIRSRREDKNSYTIFWKALKPYVDKASRIYFSPDGVYEQLNLYTLKNPETGGYLLDEADIRLVTNTRDILTVSKPVQTTRVEIFSYPDYGVKTNRPLQNETRLPGFPELKELPGTKAEADSITKILAARNWKIQTHLQKEATEEAIKKIDKPRVLHIATHGFFLKNIKDTEEKVMGMQTAKAKENPLLRSGLILAGAAAIAKDTLADIKKEDGILTAYEAAGLDLAGTELVVLSACETGLGEVTNGQGVYGLQRAFRVAGAGAVMMSLWVIDDYATQELMTLFYREWLKDPAAANKHKAFRAAQLKLKEKYPDPYFWGAFIMAGN
jgi:CHAT domain-containing protein/Flp pilus assembly protein TadD